MVSKSIDHPLKNPWEIESIKFDINKETDFLVKFIIYDDSKLIQSNIFKIATTDDFIGEIKDSQITTGIMISNMKINDLLIYLFILDNRIFIIKRINLPQFREYFNEYLDLLIFMTLECKDDFFLALSAQDQISEQNGETLKEQKYINIPIKKEIIRCAIKKAQYRTIKMRQELLPDKYNSKNDKNYNLDDFISIQSQGFYLYFNSKDQILNVLKFYTDEKRFDHEIGFYHQIENTFPFIRKIFGIIKRPNELPIIILEYIEGQSLDKFISSEKEIDFNTKIKMIEEILFSVYYIHSNGYYLRDLKPDNVIIDTQNDAILIDFDSTKEMYSPYDYDNENTCNIGNHVFAAPEQNNSNEYSYKVNTYSIGMIIHFIITRQAYNFNNFDLIEIYEKKENISRNNKFPKLPHEYEFIFNIYEKCFDISPCLRPSIAILIVKLFFNKNVQLNNANKLELPNIIKQLEKYESIFKTADKYMHEEPIELSFLEYFMGFIYYSYQYVSTAIIFHEILINQFII